MVGCETLYTCNGNTWSRFTKKYSENLSLYIYLSLYSPDGSLIVRNIYT